MKELRAIKDPLERFMNFVSPEPNSGCWLWAGAGLPRGYGKSNLRSKQWLAHRLSWHLHKGQIPDGLDVLHSCDVTCCVNPDHLFLGTHQDNMLDKVAKGRHGYTGLPGIKHHKAKLTDQDILKIRKDTRKSREIASDYGVSFSTICRIQSHKNWTHIT